MNRMRIAGIGVASLVALFAGARLALAAFAPVLPPDFDRRWEPDFVRTYWAAAFGSREQAEFFGMHGRWAESVEELLLDGRQGDRYRSWRERDEGGWRRHVAQREREIAWVAVGGDSSVTAYPSVEIVDRQVRPTGRLVCEVRLDTAYARALADWYGNPGARASSRLPDELEPWSRMTCRRTSGLRGWLAWTGLDR
ncbi:MAG: hypothetical protein R3266_13655, partial [Gemmatimonadota bacterium]|nr:hypothetical protein [Gemmatimonadota bacterium]